MREAREGFFLFFFYFEDCPTMAISSDSRGIGGIRIHMHVLSSQARCYVNFRGRVVVVAIELQYCCSQLQTGEMFLLN